MPDSNELTIGLAIVAFLALCWQTGRYMKSRNYMLFFVWPAFIYLIGPACTLMFVDAPVLSRYVDETRINIQTLLMVWYLLALVIADKSVNLSGAMRQALNGKAIQRLASSWVFPWIFSGAVLMAASMQIYLLKTFGTILSGVYTLDNMDDIPYWGFIAGLYEIIFLCFILVLLGKRPSRRMMTYYVCLYAFTTILRVLGGTRLVLIKEFAFMIIFFYVRGSISGRRLLLVAATVTAVGSGVGLLRSGGGSDGANFLGPIYGLVMESALNALTLGIADNVNHSGAVAQHASTLVSIGYFALSVVPSFLRMGITEDGMKDISPYNLAMSSGFDTYAPVGGMSGFATIDYLTSYPFIFILLMVAVFAFWFKNLRNTPFKQIFGLVAMTNAIHFWRDPADIAFKLLVQGVIVCTILYVLPPSRTRRSRTVATRHADTQELPAG